MQSGKVLICRLFLGPLQAAASQCIVSDRNGDCIMLSAHHGRALDLAQDFLLGSYSVFPLW